MDGEVFVIMISSPCLFRQTKAVSILQPSRASVKAAAPIGPLTAPQALRATAAEARPPLASASAMYSLMRCSYLAWAAFQYVVISVKPTPLAFACSRLVTARQITFASCTAAFISTFAVGMP